MDCHRLKAVLIGIEVKCLREQALRKKVAKHGSSRYVYEIAFL